MKQTLSAPERLPVEAIIQCAMDMEAAPLLDALQPLPGEDAPRSLLLGAPGNHAQAFTLGLIDGRRVLVATSGIGLANAASATARALVLVDAPLVIAAGTTGGLARGINVGDIALGLAAIYGQADATAFGYEPGQVPQMPVDYRTSDGLVRLLDGLDGALAHPVLRGRILSSDSFVTAPIAEPMRERFPDAIGADMETCAMAQVAWSAGVDWVSLRAVSDLCGPAAGQDFHMDSEEAASRSADAVRTLLALLGASSSDQARQEQARQAEGDSMEGGAHSEGSSAPGRDMR